MSNEITLKLNQYQAANLRWLLWMAISSPAGMKDYKEKFPGDTQYIQVDGLNTGDWNGEILWELEQQMIDADFPVDAANRPSPCPMTGWHGGYKTSQLEELYKKPTYVRLSEDVKTEPPQEQNPTQENEVRKKERASTAGPESL